MQATSTEPARLPRVLVLLATYNGEPWLTEQIESILAQEDVSVEIHVGDDNSKDGTRQLIASRWEREPRICLRPPAAGSGSAGANFRRMLKESNLEGCDFVAFADQDDFWQPRKLSAAIQALRDNDAAGYSCAVQAFWPDGREQVLGQVPSTTGADFLFEGAGQGCTFVLRRELAHRVQRFCLEFPEATEALHYHDWLVYLLSRAWQLRWHFDPVPWLRYRQHGGNEIGSRGRIGSVLKRLELIRDGWYKRQIVAASHIFMLANNRSALIGGFAALLSSSNTLGRRLRLAGFFLRHGRRRVSDRIVMVISAAAGWT
jgi:rhamnosyltransferase